MRGSRPTMPFAPAPAHRLRLLVVGRERVETIRLPETGDLTVGRAPDCDVAIDDPSIAERHAMLRLGPSLLLFDLAAGAVTVGGVRLPAGEKAQLSPGVVVTLGSVTVVVQSSGASARLRHVRSHDYFEGRIEDECARVDERGGSFAVARFAASPGASARIEAVIASSMRPMDVIATYAPNEYEVLFPEVEPDQGQRIVDEICTRIREAGEVVSISVACYPRDARTPEALLAVASESLTGKRRMPSIPLVTVAPVGAMDRLQSVVERIASSTISVLVLGETGVGKEVMANRIHSMSPRATKPLLCLNCAAVSETLLESELFGHERGAFTGAVQTKPGLLETADGGTVFLDEIGEMPPSAQARLLRVIAQKEVTRLGALTPRPIDVRFIAATNRDLEEEVARGTFRRDLYFRLNGFTFVIPPLRERVSEIAALAEAFVREACASLGRPAPRLSPEAREALQRYAWPGNIRELRNTIERAVVLCGGDVIDRTHLPMENMGRTLPASWLPSTPASVPPPKNDDTCPERDRILRVLEQCAGNQTKAATVLGISRRTLIARIEKYGFRRPKKAPSN